VRLRQRAQVREILRILSQPPASPNNPESPASSCTGTASTRSANSWRASVVLPHRRGPTITTTGHGPGPWSAPGSGPGGERPWETYFLANRPCDSGFSRLSASSAPGVRAHGRRRAPRHLCSATTGSRSARSTTSARVPSRKADGVRGLRASASLYSPETWHMNWSSFFRGERQSKGAPSSRSAWPPGRRIDRRHLSHRVPAKNPIVMLLLLKRPVHG
jgi:hypothetical protein